jgi:hypothetical protein
MAKAKVIHSDDAVTVVFKGNPKSPEPTMGVIKFPGGHVEVSRTKDNKYWAHIRVDKADSIKSSRIDYDFEGYTKAVEDETSPVIPDIPYHDHIEHMAIMIDGPYVASETL